ncbi:hypothetical protein PVAP13_9KG196500 [Panicum virgatum]|uniref:Xylanase inhibitor N-terminal domain-containing protein n=1 Tax=Panicum virgatum TaxID=38727 RepID=A0A8T0NLL7_PANVG|nr:hypothetical protein PVAP13_9KG196500 [Panicum virgatum]
MGFPVVYIDIGTGGQPPFPVAAVDITAPLTSTSRCAGRPVSCTNLACSAMAPRQLLCASSPIPPTCVYYGTSTVLYQGPINFGFSDRRRLHAPCEYGLRDYACQVRQAGMAAVLGLGWRGAQSLKLSGFSYSVSSNGKGGKLFPNGKVSVSVGAGVAAAVRGGGSGGSTALLSNPRNYPDLYYVRVTGIEVGEDPQQVLFSPGALDLRQDVRLRRRGLPEHDPAAHLAQRRRVRQPHQDAGSSSASVDYHPLRAQPQAAVLQEREPDPDDDDHPRPRRRHEAAGGEVLVQAVLRRFAVLGHPAFAVADRGVAPGHHDMQSGWRMTYDLSARTLTFQSSSSSPPPPLAVLPNSSCSVLLWALLLAAAAHVAFTFL